MLSIINGLLVMISLFNAGFAVLILRDSRSTTNIFLGTYFAALFIWPLALIGSQIGPTYDFWLYSAKMTYIAGLVIAASFYLFSISFPEETSPRRLVVATVYGLVMLYAVALLTIPSFLTKEIIPQGGGNGAVLEPVAYLTFTGLFLFLYVGGLIRIAYKYFYAAGMNRRRLLIIGLGVAVTGIGGLYYDILLPSPFLNEFRYIWTGPLFNTITAVLIAYAVFRLGLLSTKVLVAEFVIALLWIFTLLRTLVAAERQEQVLNGGLFFLALIIGSLLIRSVRSEVEQREEVEKLAKELESANARLKELDQLKSEFLSIASHQLRAPITAIRGYISLILEGDYGAPPDGLKDPLGRIADSSRNMASSIEDYLNVSRIEQGRMKYEKSGFDLADLVQKTTEELRPVAARRNLELSFAANAPVQVIADVGKVKQVISNLIDNAIKYTEKGSVKVEAVKEGSKARVVVSDTGMGIAREEVAGLFEKFKRARGANRVNTTGTGLGLYVAKQLVEGHEGKIWAESDGPGKGSRFIIELPA